MGILIQKTFSKLKKDPLKILNPKISTKSINFIKQTPQKVGILVPKTFSKFQNSNTKTQKRPPKNPKTKNINQIRKLYKTNPAKSLHSGSKNIFEIFKSEKKTQKRPHKNPKTKNINQIK